MQHFEIVVVSDLHLGARNSRAGEFLDFLSRVACDLLVVNGDLFECPRLGRRYRDEEAQLLRALRRRSEAGTLVWLRGNHDPLPEFAWSILGLEPRDELVIDVGPLRYLVAHGDRWDKALDLPRLVIEGADVIYRGAQILDRTHLLARMLKRRSKHFCRVVERVQTSAVAAARARKLDGVILGHTHLVGDVQCGDVHYLNSGCWTEKPSTFVGIADGQARACTFDTGLIGQWIAADEFVPRPAMAAAV